MNVVKQTKVRDGAEIDQKYSVYLNLYEYELLADLVCICFLAVPEYAPDISQESKDSIKAAFNEKQQLTLIRMANSFLKQM